jgi:hypothetical protein
MIVMREENQGQETLVCPVFHVPGFPNSLIPLVLLFIDA